MLSDRFFFAGGPPSSLSALDILLTPDDFRMTPCPKIFLPALFLLFLRWATSFFVKTSFEVFQILLQLYYLWHWTCMFLRTDNPTWPLFFHPACTTSETAGANGWNFVRSRREEIFLFNSKIKHNPTPPSILLTQHSFSFFIRNANTCRV